MEFRTRIEHRSTAVTKCFITVKNNYLALHCYKILTRTLGCNYMIHKIKISNTPLCRICNLETETLFHLFCKCQAVTNLWQDLNVWIQNKINQNIDLDSKTIILGYLNT